MTEPLLWLDHLMWAVPDLDAGIDRLAALTGCRASPGGAHPGNGTRNALLGIAGMTGPGPGCYLEIIAPDPAQLRAGTLGAELERLPQPFLRTWAIGSSDLEAVAAQLARLGVHTQGPRSMSRRTPEGALLAWQILFAQAPGLGGAMPFCIDWGESPHPSLTLGRQCALATLTVALPPGHALAPWLATVAGVTVATAPEAALTARLSTPNGPVTLQ